MSPNTASRSPALPGSGSDMGKQNPASLTRPGDHLDITHLFSWILSAAAPLNTFSYVERREIDAFTTAHPEQLYRTAPPTLFPLPNPTHKIALHFSKPRARNQN